MHDLRSDVQGDPIDRWPLSLLPIAAQDCALVGQTRNEHPQWVVQIAPPHDITHWFYIDEATGAIDRELTREGSQIFSATFDDRREALGARRPFHWRLTGFGGDAEVFVDALDGASIAPEDVAQPASAALDPIAAATAPIRLPATFKRREIFVDLTVNGRRSKFALDTGSTQILVSAAAARAFGIATLLDHGVAAQIDVGKRQLHDVPFMTVPSIFGIDGILGYDFFAGAIVHIDFQHEYVELLPRTGFVPPAGAVDVPTRFDEGLPITSATIGSFVADRVALDTGSPQVLVTRYFWEHRGLPPSALGASPLANGLPSADTFLEGPIVTRVAQLPSLTLGGTAFSTVIGLVEQTNAGATIDLPFDAILGTDALAPFEWWFDYSGGHAWKRVMN